MGIATLAVRALFFYGTLCFEPLLALVLGDRARGSAVPARLKDHAVFWVAGQIYPTIRPAAGAMAEGLLVSDLRDEGIDRLNFYEGGFDYDLRCLQVETDAGQASAEVFFSRDTTQPLGDAWSLADWVRDWGELTLRATEEVMSYHGQLGAAEVAARFPMIRARAQSALTAAESGSGSVRSGLSRADVRLEERLRPYSKFFALDDLTLRHRRFDGAWSASVNRAAFIAPDAVTVLPYDPVRDRVLVVEQFRAGPYARGDAHPWSLEPIAGRRDVGETTEATARREAQEEAGLELGQLEKIGAYYPSPGAVSEYLTSYLALADLPDTAAGLGGAEEEDEDIRGHLLSFDALMAFIDSGEAENGPLLISALWLAANRARLRSGA